MVVPWSRDSQIYYKINNNLYSLPQLINLLEYGIVSGRSECWEYPPKLSISYPVSLGDQWTFREFFGDCDDNTENNSPFRMDKLVTDMNDDTFTIQTLYDWDEDSQWDEDMRVFHTYSINGLTNYRLEMDNVITLDEFGNELGLSNTLINYNLSLIHI